MRIDSFNLRPAHAGDLPALYHVCLKTGDAGKDGTPLQDDPQLLGRVFVGPYVMLEPELAFTLEGGVGPLGYVLGALDTVAFNRRLRSDWYPALQNEIRDPGPDQAKWRGSDWVRHAVHHAFLAVPPVLALYPSHAHIDLLPEARGKGVGSRMMHHMMERLAARRLSIASSVSLSSPRAISRMTRCSWRGNSVENSRFLSMCCGRRPRK